MPQTTLKNKLLSIRDLIDECLQELDSVRQKGFGNDALQEDNKEESTNDLALHIINKTGDCDESEEIQKYVLDSRSIEGRLLLCFYVSYKYFDNKWLTSGDIEKITSELGVKIDQGNASNKLKKLKKYFESSAVRKKGQPTPYKLNRKGAKRFEEIIHEKEC